MQVVTSPVGLADFCPNQADRRDRAAASFWTVRLLGGLPGFLWCATNAAAICGHIVAHSGVRYSTQDKLFQPCCHPRLWAPSAHVFTAANADTAFFGGFPNLLHQSGQNKAKGMSLATVSPQNTLQNCRRLCFFCVSIKYSHSHFVNM